MEKGQRCWLHKAGHDSKVFINGSEEYDAAIDAGWTSERQLGEVKEETVADSNPVTLFTEDEVKTYQKNTLLEVIGVYKNGDVLVQNQGDDSDKWPIRKDIFEATYDEVEDKEGLKEDTAGFGQVDLSKPRDS